MKIVGMVLAGGRVDELLVLTMKRPKSALPFGGIYRIIDFALSNLMHSGIENVGILSQYRPYSLMNHVGLGEHWDFAGRKRGVRILPPYRGEKASDWYKGTADAVYQNLNFINEHSANLVLIVSADHIYRMNYTEMFDFHLSNNADLTVAFTKVPISTASRFGLGVMERKGRLVAYREKPAEPVSVWASMTVYLFKKEVLFALLRTNARETSHEFGRDIIPRAMANHRVFGFKHKGFWEYARTIDAYYDANLLLLRKSKLDLASWQVRTNLYERNLLGDRPPCVITNHGEIENSIVSEGCIIKGKVVNSVLSPGVVVDEHSLVMNSIIMHDTMINRECVLKDTICDKDVSFGRGVVCGEGEMRPNQDFPQLLTLGVTVIGKGARIPEGTEIGKNCLIYPDVNEGCFGKSVIASGESLRSYREEK